ncbi:Aspercryptin biosynthesis cluster-specific transcription regulator atnN [Colletotrichum spinosum]|uniref:Aspercryptin biosynthesis cluster-specific transcription regulator atnN n=1 Tax=Colletotrichum spinosum TaxID=1347390 RepID=A0A4R8QKA0_9PEZI|nr:Aspercryptin biosynthesis cluster-specific transcription regulator atnN [Colletotrichum spinosum]
MARKGSRKVRTGCFTCKVRKVKCDETKPACARCSASGRKCDGYPAPLSTELRPFLPKSPSEFPGAMSQAESRAIQFFCEMAGPNLPGATDPFFWTHLVMQFSRFEPAVKHSVVAISSLYEDVIVARARGESHLRGQRLRDNSLALGHYNAAIKQLLVMENQGLVLLVCLLFVCVELLQSNRDMALQHCAHGTAIMGSSDALSYHWVKQWVLPLFRRLNALKYFFGDDRSDLPDLRVSEYPIPALFFSFNEAESMIDDVFNQAFQLVRRGDVYRAGHKRHEDPPPDLLREQGRIVHLLDLWYTMFVNLDARCVAKKNEIKGPGRLFALTRYRTSKVWASMAFTKTEMGYDSQHEEFRVMVEDMSRAADERMQSDSDRNRNNFEFEMGLIAPIMFIVMKCRYLDLRIEALRCLAVLAAPREALWERDGMYSLARRIIEIEHGVGLDETGQIPPGVKPSCSGLPPEDMRVAHFVTEISEASGQDFYGHEVRGRKAVFVMRATDDTVRLRPDFLPDYPVALPAWSAKCAHETVLSGADVEEYERSVSSHAWIKG